MQFIKTILLLLFAMGVSFAQTQKFKLTFGDYGKWGKLDLSNTSADGRWVSYTVSYDNAPDTLFVQNVSTSKKYIFPDSSNGKFSSDVKWFTAINSKNGLALLSLEQDKLLWLRAVVQFDFYLPDNLLITRTKNGNATDLNIVDLTENMTHTFQNVSEFKISAKGNIGAVSRGKVSLIFPEQDYREITIARDSIGKYKRLSFDDKGSNLAFLQELTHDKISANHKLYNYNISKATLKWLDPNNCEKLLGLRIAAPQKITPLFFSPDSDRIFFSRSKPEELSDTSPLEIWDSELPVEYNQLNDQVDLQYVAKLTEWNPETGEVKFTASDALPTVMLTNDKEFILCYNRDKYEPQFEYNAPVDIYITNLVTGETRLFLEKQNYSGSTIIASPYGNKIAYYRNNDWWVYDTKHGCHQNITKHLHDSLTNFDEQGGMPETYGAAGWSTDGKQFFLYDQYDIWQFNAPTNKCVKITDGRKNKTRFRISESFISNNRLEVSVNFSKTVINTTDGIILEASGNEMTSGIYLWPESHGLTKLVHGNFKIDRIRKAANANAYLYTIQSAEIPPRLMLAKNDSTNPQMLFQSNAHYQKYEWGHAEIIHYGTEDKSGLKGILYYPPNFDEKKKYPMIVYIYEMLSGEFNQYKNPSLYNNTGFNPSNYALDGYLVLFPDIKYTTGSPGKSALDCVLSAVNTVKQKGIVQENRIGLIGHSFGGYEVNYIITQTPIFAAAVSGASVSDMISNYFSIHFDTEHSNMWRYETQQYRMGKNAFEDYSNYIANSPVANAANITTPLLSWTGKKDNNVPWTQSIELHLALRRLEKKNLFLVYKEEQHTIESPENQLDLTLRIRNWFDALLKE